MARLARRLALELAYLLEDTRHLLGRRHAR